MASSVSSDLTTEIYHHVDEATQDAFGSDIDVLISQLAKTKFENIAKEYKADKKDQKSNRKIKTIFTITSICLACVAVVCAIASVIFSMGVVAVGTFTVAAVTGFVGITTAFSQLDNAIYRFISTKRSEKPETTRLHKIKVKLTNVKDLISERINGLEHLQNHQIRSERVEQILAQIKAVNEFIRQVKEQVPEKVASFKVFDPSPLLKYAN